MRVDVQPGARAGAPGRVSFYPANDAVTLVNHTTTGGDTALTFDRQPGSNRIVVSGTVAAQAEASSRLITVDQPARVVGALLQNALRAHGITLRGNAEEGVTCGRPAAGGKTSPPLSRLAVTFLKVSNNGYGEVLTKAMGRKTQGKGTGLPACRRSAGLCKARASRPARTAGGRFRAVAHEPDHAAAADDAAAGGQKTAVVRRVV